MDTLSTLGINVSLNGFGYTDYTWVPLIRFDILILHDHLVSFLEFMFSMPCVPSIVLVYLCVGTVVAIITQSVYLLEYLFGRRYSLCSSLANFLLYSNRIPISKLHWACKILCHK